MPLDELRTAVPDGIEVAFAAGFGIGTTENDEQLAAEAVELAGRAGTVVAFVGLPAADESEGYDRDHMDLPPNQTELVPRLAAANPNLVVVLANGSAVRLSDWKRRAPRWSRSVIRLAGSGEQHAPTQHAGEHQVGDSEGHSGQSRCAGPG